MKVANLGGPSSFCNDFYLWSDRRCWMIYSYFGRYSRAAFSPDPNIYLSCPGEAKLTAQYVDICACFNFCTNLVCIVCSCIQHFHIIPSSSKWQPYEGQSNPRTVHPTADSRHGRQLPKCRTCSHPGTLGHPTWPSCRAQTLSHLLVFHKNLKYPSNRKIMLDLCLGSSTSLNLASVWSITSNGFLLQIQPCWVCSKLKVQLSKFSS